MARPEIKKKTYDESWLTEIPVLGYLFRFIKRNRPAIEKTLQTNQETAENIETESYLGGLITIVSRMSFNTLKLGVKNESKKK